MAKRLTHYHYGDYTFNVLSTGKIGGIGIHQYQSEEEMVADWDTTHGSSQESPKLIKCFDDGSHVVLRPKAEPLYTLRDQDGNVSFGHQNLPRAHPAVSYFMPVGEVTVDAMRVGQTIPGRVGRVGVGGYDEMQLERTA